MNERLKTALADANPGELVWDPPWTPERMSEAARIVFGWHPPR